MPGLGTWIDCNKEEQMKLLGDDKKSERVLNCLFISVAENTSTSAMKLMKLMINMLICFRTKLMVRFCVEQFSLTHHGL